MNKAFKYQYYVERKIANPKCMPSEFDCEDAVCIDQSLRCNSRVNCKFRYDEENCKVSSQSR